MGLWGTTLPRPEPAVSVPAFEGTDFAGVGSSCYYLKHLIDVPWLQITGTHADGDWAYIHVDANPGAQRTGHVTFSGRDVSRTITYIQAGAMP
jgi:hypothetical protein